MLLKVLAARAAQGSRRHSSVHDFRAASHGLNLLATADLLPEGDNVVGQCEVVEASRSGIQGFSGKRSSRCDRRLML